MSKYIVDGPSRLSGSVDIHGAKNSVLPILAATILCDEECIIDNCPDISDVICSFKILSHLGCKCQIENNTALVDTKGFSDFVIPENLMREMRSSVVFLGAILGRAQKAVISLPGGCELGPRPIDLHIRALEKMGVKTTEDHGNLYFSAGDGIIGTEIDLTFPSVGATENVILAATLAKGTTVIHNAAREPEISDLADFLNSAGARIYGAGSDTITVYGVKKLHKTRHSIIPDRIVAVTYMAAAAMTKSKITVNNVMPSHIVSVLSVFKESGCEIRSSKKSIEIKAPERLMRVPTVRTLCYPGFPTDAGPLIVAMLSLANGTSVFVENIFENRLKYTDELKRFGAKIKPEGKVAVIEGVKELSAANCECTDLRGGGAVLIASLAANGRTQITKTEHIKRGYENIAKNFKLLGASIYEE